MVGGAERAAEETPIERSAFQQCTNGCFGAGTPVLCSSGLRAIEDVAIGSRVPTTADDRRGPSIDPASHRVARLLFVKDGQEFHLAFLRPASVFEGISPGDFMEFAALELKIEGRARVAAIEPCPPIEGGNGRIVTGTFRSETVDARLLKLEGLDKPIEVTANHRIYSEDRGDFVSVHDLNRGERLCTRAGTASVESVTHKYGRREVFNLEVEGDHRYYITRLNVLVHNSGVDCLQGDAAENPYSRGGDRLPDDRIQSPPEARGDPPIGDDGNPVELHHRGQTADSPLDEMTTTDHRGAGNFGENHPNTGESPSQIDRNAFTQQRRNYWNWEWDNGRWE